MAVELSGFRHEAMEWSCTSSRGYEDPFNEVELDVVIAGPNGREWRMPGYWAGEREWRVRFAPPEVGRYVARSVCSDSGNASLHGRGWVLTAEPYTGDNALLRHGPLRVSEDRRHFEHADGTPFFWLADTWWMGLCRRMRWPEEFQLLTADRRAKGFTVIQIVAGLYPDMPAFDPRAANEAGQPWTEGFGRINPAYFDMADLRIGWLVRNGLVPCLTGCWGFFLPWMGERRMKQHWRYLIARYGAYPVVWCLAGEGSMPWYLSKDRAADQQMQIKGWTELGRYVRQVDPYRHPITIHPTDSARKQVEQDDVLDFDMLQTGHSGHDSMAPTYRAIAEATARRPRMPVVNGEVCYEGIMGRCGEEIQRMAFWGCMLRGAAGHTYGANGIWQVETPDDSYGASPHGASWGGRAWREALGLPGAAHVAIGKQLLSRYEWWRLEPRPEAVEPHGDAADPGSPSCAGIGEELYIIYLPGGVVSWAPPHHVRQLKAGSSYRSFFVDPRTGREYDLGRIIADHAGSWRIPLTPIIQDFLLVLERRP